MPIRPQGSPKSCRQAVPISIARARTTVPLSATPANDGKMIKAGHQPEPEHVPSRAHPPPGAPPARLPRHRATSITWLAGNARTGDLRAATGTPGAAINRTESAICAILLVPVVTLRSDVG